MVGIDISTLSLVELKRLADAAEARGQTSLANILTQELRNRAARIGQRRPEPIAPPAPLVASLLPIRRRAAARPAGPKWRLAVLACVTISLAWGMTLPNDPPPTPRILTATPLRQALAAAPVADAFCANPGESADAGCTPPGSLPVEQPAAADDAPAT